MANASRCGLSNPDRKTEPPANSSAPASVAVLMTNIVVGITPPRITSMARRLSTLLEQPVKSQRKEQKQNAGDQVADDAQRKSARAPRYCWQLLPRSRPRSGCWECR
jgi:hypothetical protein